MRILATKTSISTKDVFYLALVNARQQNGFLPASQSINDLNAAFWQSPFF